MSKLAESAAACEIVPGWSYFDVAPSDILMPLRPAVRAYIWLIGPVIIRLRFTGSVGRLEIHRKCNISSRSKRPPSVRPLATALPSFALS